MFRRAMGRLAVGSVGAAGLDYVGRQVQGHYGSQTFQDAAPEGGRRGEHMPIEEQYSRERQSNQVFPEGRHFMSYPMYAGGNIAGQMGMPQSAMDLAVRHFSDPSSESAMDNRNRLALGLGVVGAGLMRFPSVPSMVAGAGLMGAGGFLHGAESTARTQGEAVTGRTGPSPEMTQMSREEIGQHYGDVSALYGRNGFAPQQAVSSALPHTPENLHISQFLQRSVVGHTPADERLS